MSLKPHIRAAITFIVLMVIALPLLIVAAGANIGPFELLVWLILFVVGLTLCLRSGRGSKSRAS